MIRAGFDPGKVVRIPHGASGDSRNESLMKRQILAGS